MVINMMSGNLRGGRCIISLRPHIE